MAGHPGDFGWQSGETDISAAVMARKGAIAMDKPSISWYNLSVYYVIREDNMPFSPLPKIITEKLTDITPELLRGRNIRLLMLDFDNTIVPYTTTVPTEEMESWLKTMNELPDIRLCIVSNSHNDRVPRFCRERNMAVITHAKKPFTKGINECLAKYDIPASEAALVGDQIYTDTLGANSAGVTSILVKAIDNHNFWLKARHVLEKPFIFAARKRRI